jgi:hypothetical protein
VPQQWRVVLLTTKHVTTTTATATAAELQPRAASHKPAQHSQLQCWCSRYDSYTLRQQSETVLREPVWQFAGYQPGIHTDKQYAVFCCVEGQEGAVVWVALLF